MLFNGREAQKHTQGRVSSPRSRETFPKMTSTTARDMLFDGDEFNAPFSLRDRHRILLDRIDYKTRLLWDEGNPKITLAPPCPSCRLGTVMQYFLPLFSTCDSLCYHLWMYPYLFSWHMASFEIFCGLQAAISVHVSHHE